MKPQDGFIQWLDELAQDAENQRMKYATARKLLQAGLHVERMAQVLKAKELYIQYLQDVSENTITIDSKAVQGE